MHACRHASTHTFPHLPSCTHLIHPTPSQGFLRLRCPQEWPTDKEHLLSGQPVSMRTTPNTLMGGRQSHRPQTSSKQQTTVHEMYALASIWPCRYREASTRVVTSSNPLCVTTCLSDPGNLSNCLQSTRVHRQRASYCVVTESLGCSLSYTCTVMDI